MMKRQEIVLVVAAALNGVIGNNNQLIWSLPDDLKRFKQITMGHPILMGRNTFQSIGKPLPGRRNVVISCSMKPRDGVEIFKNTEEALEALSNAGAICVIGGGQIYAQLLPLADRIFLTVVESFPEGDTFFEFDKDEWVVLNEEQHPVDDKHAYPFRFQELVRRFR